MNTYRTFTTLQEARDYRHDNGTGGWIFAPAAPSTECVLFPPEMTPTAIFTHPLTRGQFGMLHGA